MINIFDLLRINPINCIHHNNFPHTNASPLRTHRPTSSHQHHNHHNKRIQPITRAAKKGDGKQRRKKSPTPQSPSASSLPLPPSPTQQTPSTPSSTAPRINPNSLIPVRKQIKLVQAYKEIVRTQSSSYRAPSSTAPYRKETKTPEEYRSDRIEKEKEEDELSKIPSKNFALRSLYNTCKTSARSSDRRSRNFLPTKTTPVYLTSSQAPSTEQQQILPTATTAMRLPPILLVDAYNVLHKWDRTEPMLTAGNLADARDILIEAMATYSHCNGVRVVIAFDAMQGPRGGMGVSEEILSTGITIAYCGDREADTFIEQQVEEWLSRGYPAVVVATSDVAHAAVVQSKSRPSASKQMCFVVPSSGLIKDIEATEKRVKRQLEELETPTMSLLGSVVKSKDENAFSAMQKMRVTLPSASQFRMSYGVKGSSREKKLLENTSKETQSEESNSAAAGGGVEDSSGEYKEPESSYN